MLVRMSICTMREDAGRCLPLGNSGSEVEGGASSDRPRWEIDPINLLHEPRCIGCNCKVPASLQTIA